MKKIWFIAASVLFFTLGCATGEADSDKKSLTVTVLPQKDITEQITGDMYEVNVMIPPGASPATYEPTPRQIGKLNQSEAYLKIGHIVFEKAWMDKFQSTASGLKIFDMSKGLDLIEGRSFSTNHNCQSSISGPHISSGNWSIQGIYTLFYCGGMNMFSQCRG